MTVEAQSYGPGSLIGIKVVEQVPAGVVQQQLHQHQQQSTPQSQQHVRTVVQSGSAQATPHRPTMPPPAPSAVHSHQQTTPVPQASQQPRVINTPPRVQRKCPYPHTHFSCQLIIHETVN